MCSMLTCFVSLGTVFLGMMDLSNCLSNSSMDHQLFGFVNTTTIPGISNSSRATELYANSSTVSAQGIHPKQNTSHSNNSSKTTTSAPTVKNRPVTITKHANFPTELTTHHNEHRLSSKIYTNAIMPTKKLPEVTTVKTLKTTPEATIESVIGSHWDGWKRLLTKNYWKKRIDDKQYLMELLIPTAAGIGLCLVLVTIFGLLHCLISLRYKRKRKHRMDYHSSEKLNDNTWMLLENSDSEEEAV